MGDWDDTLDAFHYFIIGWDFGKPYTEQKDNVVYLEDYRKKLK